MRHTPCGCAPYGEGAFHIRRARPLGVPSAKRQTVQMNEFVRIWWFLHRSAISRARFKSARSAPSLFTVHCSYLSISHFAGVGNEKG